MNRDNALFIRSSNPKIRKAHPTLNNCKSKIRIFCVFMNVNLKQYSKTSLVCFTTVK